MGLSILKKDRLKKGNEKMGHDEQARFSTEWVISLCPDPHYQAAIRRILVPVENANTGLEE
ncbi:MAG: hypothetical protein A2X25_11900 [Chloroflexi bacterium GWB2_49_20]|nr:MAG: hypothetical protein A2X25_11900 [Chloroflexi bacterium GWB2_49_20]OGN77707.1 MAG: hypothetical protein A2X26_10170 [Chloroflexi bacterium GWC2_49_37]